MKKYVCEPCGYEYDPAVGDPDNGIAPGTAFEDLPEDWVCPICGMGKEEFVEAQVNMGMSEDIPFFRLYKNGGLEYERHNNNGINLICGLR